MDAGTQYIWDTLGGVKEVLSHGSIDHAAGLLSFVAIARFTAGERFTSDEARWIEILAPHLEATLQICRVSELQHSKPDNARTHRSRSAVCDARGVLHVAEPGFGSLLQEGWPDWQGPLLPRELIEIASLPGQGEVRRGNISVSASGVAQQRIIKATRKLPVDYLTPQELVVARAYADGLSYKEVAKRLERSPATVRHHLRSVYTKLEISDKAALARSIFDGES